MRFSGWDTSRHHQPSSGPRSAGSSLGPLGLVAFFLALTWIVGTSCVVLLRRTD